MTKRACSLTLIVVLAAAVPGCSYQRRTPPRPSASDYPVAVDLDKVGEYPALTKSGGGYFYDEVLEYRVWVHPGGDDYYRAFATYEEAEEFSRRTAGSEEPLVLVLQRESIDEPEPGKYVHVKGDRITEWQVQWLRENKRGPDSIPEFLRQKAEQPAQRLAPTDAD